MRSTGIVLAAGGIAAANEVIFAPLAHPGSAGKLEIQSAFNWRLVPATIILALLMGGLERLAPDFAVGLSGLLVVAVLITPLGNAGSPLENISKAVK